MTTKDQSLLAHLASRLTARTETLATEALGYILSQSQAARDVLRETANAAGLDVGEITRVQTEVGGEKNERVDLVGFDALERERVLVEAKFWAALTQHQPGTYLDRLSGGLEDQPSVLLFVAPEKRLETLWAEVCRRVEAGGRTLERQEGHRARIDGGPHGLVLTSWRGLLQTMASRAAMDRDASTERDLMQLSALCERQDADAFLPLRTDEFGPEIPRRLLGLQKLIDDATERACAGGFADTNGLKVTPQTYGYGRYLRIGTSDAGWAVAWFGVDYRRWAREQELPLWIEFTHHNRTTAFISAPDGGRHIPWDDLCQRLEHLHFYIPLPVQVEYDAVLEAVVGSLRWLAGATTGTEAL